MQIARYGFGSSVYDLISEHYVDVSCAIDILVRKEGRRAVKLGKQTK